MHEVDRRSLLKGFALAPFSLRPIESLLAEPEPLVRTRILYYHEIRESQFYSNIAGYLQQGRSPISLDDFYLGLKGEIEIPANSFMVTLDDGFLSQYTQGLKVIDDIQERYGVFVPLTVFAMTRFDGLPLETEDIPNETLSFSNGEYEYMKKGQLLDFLQLGHSLQNITVDHKSLTAVFGEEKRQQVVNAEKRIDDLWRIAGRERQTKAFAYPNGAYFGQEDYIRDLGFDLAFATTGKDQHRYSNRFALGRFSR